MKDLASAKFWAHDEAQPLARDSESSSLAHCERESQHHCDPLTLRTLWVSQVGQLTLWAQGLGA